MTAEDIVRALAVDVVPGVDDPENPRYCHFCGRDAVYVARHGTYDDEAAGSHEPDCLWVAAVRWLAEQEPAPDARPAARLCAHGISMRGICSECQRGPYGGP